MARRGLLGVLLTAMLLLSTGLHTGTHGETELPAHVHPLVAAAVRAQPDQTVRVIISRAPGADAAEEAAARLGARVTARWDFINAFAAEVPAGQVGALAQLPGVRAVLPNNRVETQTGKKTVNDKNLVNAYNYAIRADKVWYNGYDGTGVTVAVVDSGISAASDGNSDFGQRLLGSAKFNSDAVYAADRYGHGTHVAGIVGGDGTVSRGKYIGVAPGVNLLNIKFSDDNGTAYEEDLISALQWVYDHRTRYNIRVLNLSSTIGTQLSYTESATAAALEQLWFAGVVVVVSVGNHGGEDCAVCYPPANDPFLIAVGAVDDNGTKDLSDDFMKPWSSYGTTQDGYAKPDVVAPGAHIVSYMPAGNLRDHKSNVVDKYYFRMGGTSMAAPMVTGAVALMLQVNPDLTPNQVKWILMNTTRSYKEQIPGTPGIIQADAATFYKDTPGEANQGLTPSPLIDPDSGTIDYSNAFWSNAFWSNAFWSNSVDY